MAAEQEEFETITGQCQYVIQVDLLIGPAEIETMKKVFMDAEMNEQKVRPLSGGVNQRGVRDFNERLLLSMIQRHGEMPGSDLARRAGLSPQTVSVIIRKLERDGLLARGKPVRGRVGKPSTPITLAADGVFSFGLKIGRRTADILLMDFCGTVQKQLQTTYQYPMPSTVFSFLEAGLKTLTQELDPPSVSRISGIGIAAPFEIWNWHESVGAPAEEFEQWKNIDFRQEVAKFSALPLFVVNDATAACRAEHVFGRGKEFRDYAYFFLGVFIGGGIVLNHSVYEGTQGNAGAFGPLRSIGANGKTCQLLDAASIYLLENALAKAGMDPDILWAQPQEWSGFENHLEHWIEVTAKELAIASLNTCAVIDFEAIIVDGAIPAEVRRRLVKRMQAHIVKLDSRGLIVPRIEEGSVGGNARAIGAACGPVFSQFFLDTHAGMPVL